MNYWPPMWAYVKIKGSDHRFGFWLPLFLGFLILGALFLAFLPLVLLVVIILWPIGWGRWLIEAIKTGYIVLCSLKGLKVDIQNQKDIIYVNIV